MKSLVILIILVVALNAQKDYQLPKQTFDNVISDVQSIESDAMINQYDEQEIQPMGSTQSFPGFVEEGNGQSEEFPQVSNYHKNDIKKNQVEQSKHHQGSTNYHNQVEQQGGDQEEEGQLRKHHKGYKKHYQQDEESSEKHHFGKKHHKKACKAFGLILLGGILSLILRRICKKCKKRRNLKIKKNKNLSQGNSNGSIVHPTHMNGAPLHPLHFTPAQIQNSQVLYNTVDQNGIPHVVVGVPLQQNIPQQQVVNTMPMSYGPQVLQAPQCARQQQQQQRIVYYGQYPQECVNQQQLGYVERSCQGTIVQNPVQPFVTKKQQKKEYESIEMTDRSMDMYPRLSE